MGGRELGAEWTGAQRPSTPTGRYPSTTPRRSSPTWSLLSSPSTPYVRTESGAVRVGERVAWLPVHPLLLHPTRKRHIPYNNNNKR